MSATDSQTTTPSRRRTRTVRRTAALTTALVLLGVQVAAAAWVIGARPGAAAAKAISLPTVAGVSATTTGPASASVSWLAVPPPQGAPATTYRVLAWQNGSSRAPQGACAGTDGLVTVTSCEDSPVPDGTWTYRVSVVLASWTGSASTPSGSVTFPGDACGNAVNAVVAENCRKGNPPSEWDIAGDGDTTLQGFATDISVDRGTTVSFKVDDKNEGPYRIDIYRLGYYRGDGARLISTVPTTEVTPTAQAACSTDAIPIVGSTTQGKLLDCGNWSVSASWHVPETATSGVYIARLTRTGSSAGASHIPFIVRNDASTSDLVFQTSDTTWQSYNPYGGYNAYGSSGATMAEKLSYNRPFATRGAELENYLFNSEFPMIRWLERNGYDVSYISAVDTERHAQLLMNHHAFMSIGHDEYWSEGRREAVTAARDAGVSLAFISGNEVYWKTRWEKSAFDSQDYRTQVVYKEGSSAPSGREEHRNCWNNYDCDPEPGWTGQWREASGSTPENSLSGQISWRMNSGAITVPADYSSLRFWRNTDVATLQPGEQVTLANTLGYEWDPESPQYAGSYPAGRIRLSTTYAESSFGGPSEHHLSLYRASSGALVFGAGTVQWQWGLDATHDRGTTTEDRNVQQATVNLFADMHARAATLQSGLVSADASTDLAAPTSTITAPADTGTIAAGSTVEVAGTTSESGGGEVAGVEVSIDNGTSWRPATRRRSAWTYSFESPTTIGASLTIRSRATDDSLNTEKAGPGVTVTMVAHVCTTGTPCSVFQTPGAVKSVDDGPQKAVELGTRVRSTEAGQVTGIRIFKAGTTTETYTGRLYTSAGVQLGESQPTALSGSGWRVLPLTAPVSVAPDTTYVAAYYSPTGRYAATAGDLPGTLGEPVVNPPLTAPADSSTAPNGVYRYGTGGGFPTTAAAGTNYWADVLFVSGPDTTAPLVSSTTPIGEATDVAITGAVMATFSEPVASATVTGTTFTLKASTGASVSGTVESAGATVTLTPGAPLAMGTEYTATLAGGTSGITDMSGNPMASTYSWSFSTTSSTAITLFGEHVPGATGGDPLGSELGVRFTSTTDGLVSGIRFYKGLLNTGQHTGHLWDAERNSLGTVTFEMAGESVAGWQRAFFDVPVPVQAGATYIASYTAPNGNYAYESRYFADGGHASGPLTAPQSTGDAPNGVYSYSPGAFPASTFDATNYFVDIVFQPGSDTTAPTVVTHSPAAGATRTAIDAPVTATFSEPVRTSTVDTSSVTLTGGGTGIPATVSAQGTRVTLTPTDPLTPETEHTVQLAGGANGITDRSGNPLGADVTWSFTTGTPPPDTTPPTIVSRTPAPGTSNASTTATVVVQFSEAVRADSVTPTAITLTGPDGPVAAARATRGDTVTLTPTSALAAEAPYTVTVLGGAAGVADRAGNGLAEDATWSFTTKAAAAPRPDPTQGPGGPVLAIVGTGDFGTYLPEILRGEGLNHFTVGDLGDLTSASLDAYTTVVLGETELSPAQVATLTTWVEGGGNLVALRPDAQLAGLLGLTTQPGTDVREGYLKVDTSRAPGAGIESATMQFHGTADSYGVQGGTQVVATLYSDATTKTDNPAVTVRGVGDKGGSAAAFTYDLAGSVVLTRQGNPDWAGQERDGLGPNRADDLFFGAKAGDLQPDYVDLDKVAIPQADEQQRLLANVMTQLSLDALPLPRFWYLPRGEKAAVVLTADEHATGDSEAVQQRFAAEQDASTEDCSVADWDCIRSTSYLYPEYSGMTASQAKAFEDDGFEIALHPYTGCESPSREGYADLLARQLGDLATRFPGIAASATSRNHCIAWTDYTTVPEELTKQGIHLDTNYYYWPDTWVKDVPGLFTGSGFAQRFATSGGKLIDVYQATTQMTDESGQTYPDTVVTLMANAVDKGYYGAFVANLHTDHDLSDVRAASVIAAAQARGVPLISAQQLLTWTDGRNASSFGDLTWSADRGELAFTIAVGSGARGLEAMLPLRSAGGGHLQTLTRQDTVVPTTTRTVKGVEYAVFPATAGAWTAAYTVVPGEVATAAPSATTRAATGAAGPSDLPVAEPSGAAAAGPSDLPVPQPSGAAAAEPSDLPVAAPSGAATAAPPEVPREAPSDVPDESLTMPATGLSPPDTGTPTSASPDPPDRWVAEPSPPLTAPVTANGP